MQSSVLVDTNVWLDIINEDPVWQAWSEDHIADIVESQRAAINVVIYGELSVRYAQIEDFENVIAPFGIERLAMPFEAGFLAAKAFARYRQRGGSKRTTLPDFFIGAHAAVAGLTLLTRDATRYREYFPKLKLIAPK